jgi:hypothetical protein
MALDPSADGAVQNVGGNPIRVTRTDGIRQPRSWGAHV